MLIFFFCFFYFCTLDRGEGHTHTRSVRSMFVASKDDEESVLYCHENFYETWYLNFGDDGIISIVNLENAESSSEEDFSPYEHIGRCFDVNFLN